VGADVDGFVCERGPAKNAEGVAMHIFRHSSTFKDLDAATLSKANHLMACAELATAHIVEMYVSHRVQEAILKAETEGRAVDYQRHVAAGDIKAKVTVVSYKPKLWAPVETMYFKYADEYMKPVLAAGIEEWAESPVCTSTILGRLMSHTGGEECDAVETANDTTPGSAPTSNTGSATGGASGDSSQSRGGESANSHTSDPVGQVSHEGVRGNSENDGDSTDDETHTDDTGAEPTAMQAAEFTGNTYWDFDPDCPRAHAVGVQDIQLEWGEDGNDNKLSRSGLMIATTMVRILDQELPKGILVHGMAGSGKTAVVMRLIPEIMAKKGYDRDRVAIVTPTNTTANNATHACTDTAPEVFTSNKWLAMDLGEESVETIKACFDTGGAKYKEAAKRARRAHVLIWEEFGMQKEEYLRKFDHILRYLRQCDEPFGGLMIVSLCEVVQLGPVPNNDSTRGGSAQDRSADYEKLFFYNYQYESEDGTKAVGSQVFLPNMIEVFEQYRMKDPELLTVALQMQMGGDGIRKNGARSIRSRLQQNGATIQKHALATLPTHRAVNQCNDGKYDVIRKCDPTAQEEKYKIVAYGLRWDDTDRKVVYVEQMQQGTATELIENYISRLENIKAPRLSVKAMYALTKKMDVVEVGSGEMITVHAGDVVECTGFDDADVALGVNDVNVRNTSIYPVMRDATGREFRMRPHCMRVGTDGRLGDLYVAHMPLRFAWAGTVHVTQGVTIRSPNQLVIDLAGLFAHGAWTVVHVCIQPVLHVLWTGVAERHTLCIAGQGYVALTRVERLDQLVITGFDKTRIFVCSGAREWIENVLVPAAARLEADNIAYLTEHGLRARLQQVNRFYVDFLQRDSETADEMLNIYLQRARAVLSEGCGTHRYVVTVNGGESTALQARQTVYGRADFNAHFSSQVSAVDCSRKHFAVTVDERRGTCTVHAISSSPTFIYDDDGTKVATLQKGDGPHSNDGAEAATPGTPKEGDGLHVLARGQYVKIYSHSVGADLVYRFTDMYDLRATMARCDVRVRRPTASKRPRASGGARGQADGPNPMAGKGSMAPVVAGANRSTDAQSEPQSQVF
jgi:hypothetical protein